MEALFSTVQNRFNLEHLESKEVSHFFSPDAFPPGKTDVPVCRVKQMHGEALFIAEAWNLNYFREPVGVPPEGDGIITQLPGVLLTVYSADCLPLLFYEKNKKIIAAVHAGWRGSFLNIAGRTVQKMKGGFGADPSSLHVGIGPSIHSCCFEIREDVFQTFYRQFPQWKDLISGGGEKRRLDLQTLNRRQLMDQGVPEKSILISETCTCCDPEQLPSYRRMGTGAGRWVSGIILRPMDRAANAR